MRSKVIIASLAAFAVAAVSCSSQKAETISSQEASIDSYIEKSHSEREVHRDGGSNRIVMVLGEGEGIVAGDRTTVGLKGHIFSNGPGTLFYDDTVTVKIGAGEVISGLDTGLRGARAGEQCYIVFSAKYGFYDKAVGIVPAMSPLLYEAEIISIEKAK